MAWLRILACVFHFAHLSLICIDPNSLFSFVCDLNSLWTSIRFSHLYGPQFALDAFGDPKATHEPPTTPSLTHWATSGLEIVSNRSVFRCVCCPFMFYINLFIQSFGVSVLLFIRFVNCSVHVSMQSVSVVECFCFITFVF